MAPTPRPTPLALAAVLSLTCVSCKQATAGPVADEPESVEEDAGSNVEDPDAIAKAAEEETRLELEARRARRQAKVEASAWRITEDVAEARELEIISEFSVELIDKDGVREFVRDVMDDELTREEIAVLGRIDAALGIIPVGSDFEQILLDMYEFGVLGIYDPKRKTLLIGDYVAHNELGRVVGHEGAHGLQDMHFDLEALNHMHKGHSDSDTAQTFLIEGDAEAAYLASVSGDEGLSAISDDMLRLQADMVLKIDESMGIQFPILARQMQMPYSDGTMNVVKLARDEGWAAVDALYADLPASSEQMLHLDKLRARETPIEVRVDAAPLLALVPDHQVAWEDELGEATLLAMLADVVSVGKARQAAAGWGGDRFIALERKTNPDPAPFVIGVVTWDTQADAKQFEAAFRTYLETHKPDQHVIVRKRNTVLYAIHHLDAIAVSGADPQPDPADLRVDVSRAGWQAFEVQPRPKKPSKKKSK